MIKRKMINRNHIEQKSWQYKIVMLNLDFFTIADIELIVQREKWKYLHYFEKDDNKKRFANFIFKIN